MRKITLLICLMLCIPTVCPAQGFLKKLKQKVENAVGYNEEEESTTTIEEENTSESTREATPAEKLQKRRTATATWDEMITPSKAGSIEELLNDLPALPSAVQLASPDESVKAAYYRKIVAVNMRVEELDKQWACSDEEMESFRNKMYNEAAAALGLTPDELKEMEDPNIPEARQKELEDKILKATVGDVSGLEALANSEKNSEEMSQEEAIALFEQLQNSSDGLMTGNSKLADFNLRSVRVNQEVVSYTEKMRKLREDEGAISDCEKIASDYESKLKNIYDRINSSSDRNEIDNLYAQADEMIANYRTRAAKIWRSSLQRRLTNMKAMLPEIAATQETMVSEGMIPDCAMRRAPLNVVTDCSNILNSAYSDFPQPEVIPGKKEVLLTFSENEYLLTAESGYATSVDGFINNSTIFTTNSSTGVLYEYRNGKKTEVTEEEVNNFDAKKIKREPEYGEWTSANGMRKVAYTKDGALTLHGNIVIYPMAFNKDGDVLTWICTGQGGRSIEKYTYTL